MKIKVLTRNPNDYKRETKHDIHKVQRNYDPALHPFELPREYKRALNAVKLDRVFAKPFIAPLQGHCDVVQTLMKHPTRLSIMASGSCDGQIKLWNLTTRKCFRTIQASNSVIRSLCPRRYEVPSTVEDEEVQGNVLDPGVFFSVDDSSNIKMWRYEWNEDMGYDKDEPLHTILASTVLGGIDSHYKKPLVMTCGERVDVWEETRNEPLLSYKWNIDTIYGVKFNPVETDLAVAAGSDRSLILYDIRQKEPLRKVILALRSNAVCWNPMEGMHFTAANEDYDCYTFDMRKLSDPMVIHKDHVQAVIDIDYSPTGKEFVTGSYDKTIRIYPTNSEHSREIYHTKRMQKLTSVLWSLDNKYVISASDEMDIRLWKSNASEKLGPKRAREDNNFKYQEKLKEKFGHHPEIRGIMSHRHVPKGVYGARKELKIIKKSQMRKEKNRRLHSKPGSIPKVPSHKRQIVREDE